jgi:hypothetical protein
VYLFIHLKQSIIYCPIKHTFKKIKHIIIYQPNLFRKLNVVRC